MDTHNDEAAIDFIGNQWTDTLISYQASQARRHLVITTDENMKTVFEQALPVQDTCRGCHADQ